VSPTQMNSNDSRIYEERRVVVSHVADWVHRSLRTVMIMWPLVVASDNGGRGPKCPIGFTKCHSPWKEHKRINGNETGRTTVTGPRCSSAFLRGQEARMSNGRKETKEMNN
jgi:hypothetical protein